jgi:hypothetical protein
METRFVVAHRRRSRTSRSEPAIRAASALEVPGRFPASISARFNQPRKDSTPIPSCFAIRGTTPKLWPPCTNKVPLGPGLPRASTPKSTAGFAPLRTPRDPGVAPAVPPVIFRAEFNR